MRSSIDSGESRHGFGRRAAEQPEGAARRTEIRLPVRLLGSLATADGPTACVQVDDLSRGGARCRVPAPPAIGSAVELRLDGLCVPAIVCWTAGAVCGLRFLRQIRATDILIQVGRSRPDAEGGPERIRFPAATPRARQTGIAQG